MGVHYFYTWITRRYPLFRKRYDSQLMPTIDNFYIDLNGVLYRCAKDQGAIFRDILKGKGFDEIFSAVVNYINYIVNHVKPNKRLFIAIDGVAPRAKMNNQRQRRCHSAKNNKDMNLFLENTLETPKGLISFKNNSISPGTEFMMTLIEHLRFFIQRKIKEDPNWRKIEVILSGGDVPGEGEHKIMDWIRAWKQGPDYDINESHCIYGNDSDLVFLCLALHLPNMVILREEMVWDRRKVNSATKRETSKEHMELLFINLLREYMLLEYTEIEKDFKHEFDIERIIDDFTLLSFFIGNDFLHKLYCMNTRKGNFDEIIRKFKKTLAGLDGYVSEKGKVNWKRFLVILNSIADMENKMINTTLGDMESFLTDLEKSSYSYVILDDEEVKQEPKKKKGKIEEIKENLPIDKTGSDDEKEIKEKKEEKEEKVEEKEEKVEEKKEEMAENDVEEDQVEIAEIDDAEEMIHMIAETIEKDYSGEKKSVLDKNHELEYKTHYSKIKAEAKYIAELISTLKNGSDEEKMGQKSKFYQKFFNVKNIGKLKQICREYLKGVQFVMYYYFRGCPSWEWYYPYFMSPMLSDLVVILDNLLDENINLEFTFKKTEPYKPFNQLMFILPKASLGLLPSAYEQYIFKEGSPIAKFYPETYNFAPFDGIKDYMWIAQIEVIDKELIDKYMEGFDYDSLSDEDKLRNRRGDDLRYTYDPESTVQVASTLQGIPDFEVNLKIEKFNIRTQYEFNWENISLSQKDLKPNGFPSLFLVKNVSVNIHRNSRRAKYDKVVLNIKSDESLTSQKFYKPFGGKVYYDYPFRLEGSINTLVSKRESKSIGSLDSKKLNQIIRESRSKDSGQIFYTVADDVSKYYFFQKGIDLKLHGSKEFYYEIEKPKSSWRTSGMDKDGGFGQVVHEFENVNELHPHTLIFKKKDGDNLINVCQNESDMLRKDGFAINLASGDLLQPEKFQLKNKPALSEYKVINTNSIGSRPVCPSYQLMEDEWIFVDQKFLKEVGLRKNHATILWFIIDSFVIKTESSRTSSIVLGEFFNIGLNFMDCLSRFRNTNDMRVVTDMIKIFRVNHSFETALFIRKRNEYLPHKVYLTKQAKDMIKEYVELFPEVIDYIADNLSRFQNPKKIPKDHDVKRIFKLSKGEDPNIKLFNIYSWIMKNPTNTLKLHSALCLNASSEKVKGLVETIDKKREKYQGKPGKLGKIFKLDKNIVMHNNPNQLPVGTTFRNHPSYPSIGDRIVIISNTHKHVMFGTNGTVIGTYKFKIEVLFDEPFIGGTSLSGRCPPFRGAIVDFFDIFNTTNWIQDINKRSYLESKGRRAHIEEWDGRIDMMLLINKMNKYRRDYENKTFKERKKSGNNFNERKKSGKNFKGNSRNQRMRPNNRSSLKKTSTAFVKKGNANKGNRGDHQLFDQLGAPPQGHVGIPVYNQQAGFGNYVEDDDEEDFQQTFHLTGDGNAQGHHGRNRNQKRSGDHRGGNFNHKRR